MKKLTIEVKKDKDKLLKYLCDSNINISYSNLNKLLRKKDVKVNGIRQTENIDIVRGDVIDVFVNENMLTTKSDAVKVIYEDDNILIIDKPRLKEVISGVGYDLLQDAREYLKSKDPSSYIAPVHRLDKDTRGLVVFAKNQKSENELLEAFKNRTIHKYYTATVQGIFPYKDATKRAYLYKDNKKARVSISNIPQKGYDEIITHFKLKKKNKNNTSDLEIELITGKTHQIRAHLAYLGFPLIGDIKYNPEAKTNKIFNLTATKIVFSFKPYHILYYLNGKQILLKG